MEEKIIRRCDPNECEFLEAVIEKRGNVIKSTNDHRCRWEIEREKNKNGQNITTYATIHKNQLKQPCAYNLPLGRVE